MRNLLDPRSSCSCEAHSLKRHGIALAGSAHLTHPTSTPLGAAVTRGPSSLGSTQSLTSTKTGKLLNDAETHMITEVGMLGDWFGATDGLSWKHIQSISLMKDDVAENYHISGCASCKSRSNHASCPPLKSAMTNSASSCHRRPSKEQDMV